LQASKLATYPNKLLIIQRLLTDFTGLIKCALLSKAKT